MRICSTFTMKLMTVNTATRYRVVLYELSRSGFGDYECINRVYRVGANYIPNKCIFLLIL
jgi:hypothetical protein